MKKICRTLSAIFQRVYYQLFAIWQSLIAKLWAPTVFTTMITTSSLQNYKKVIEYGRFSQKLKIIAKKLGTFRNNIYLCTQNNGRVPFIGIGVSPIGRVVRFVATLFLCLLGWIDFEAQKFAVLHEYIGSQYVIGQIDCLWIQNVASQWVSYQVGNLQTRNVF